MTSVKTQPNNLNFLSPVGFKFSLKKCPTLEYFVQSVAFPSLQIGQSDFQNPIIKIPVPGDQLQYNLLDISFKLDEDLKTYLELHEWLMGLASPVSHDRNIEWANGRPVLWTEQSGPTSSAVLTILTSQMNGNIAVDFYDLYPVKLGGFTFDATNRDIDYITCTASFVYRQFEFRVL